MADVLKFLSWNIKGANLAIKRKKLLLYLKQKKVDVCFLQETHLDNEESKLQRDWVGKIFYSAYSSSQRSVGILIRKNVNVTIHKQLSDREGRWVAISADLFGSGCSLINIYAPNIDCPDFFGNICCVAKQLGNAYVIIGGDFNQVRDPALDKSRGTNTRSIHKSQLAIDVLEDELGLVAIWRTLHPQEREYTFYSNPHSLYSRIDYFLISKQLVSTVIAASVGNIVLSDHAPVEVVLGSKAESETPRGHWRLNTSLLKNDKSCDFIKKEILEYWEFNEGSASNPGLEWDAFKACLRGRLIQHSSYLKKQAAIRSFELEKEIKDLEKIYASQLDPVVLTQLKKLKFELNSILQRKAEFSLFQCRQKYYE